jgi:serine protease Do
MITDDVAYVYNLPVKRGAYIAPSSSSPSIIPGSPAEKAGLKEKDIITKIDGEELSERSNLVTVIGKKSVGAQVELTILRDGNEQKLKVTLEAVPEN